MPNVIKTTNKTNKVLVNKAEKQPAATKKTLTPEGLKALFDQNPDLFALIDKTPKKAYTKYPADPQEIFPKIKVGKNQLEMSQITRLEGDKFTFVLDHLSRKILNEQSNNIGYAAPEIVRQAVWIYLNTLVKDL
jgi:hypothetical protein